MFDPDIWMSTGGECPGQRLVITGAVVQRPLTGNGEGLTLLVDPVRRVEDVRAIIEEVAIDPAVEKRQSSITC